MEAPADVENASPLLTRPLKSNVAETMLQGPGAGDKIRQLIAATDGVLIFSKETCPFCLEGKRTFFNLGVPHVVRLPLMRIVFCSAQRRTPTCAVALPFSCLVG
jgi:hypothetical protein